LAQLAGNLAWTLGEEGIKLIPLIHDPDNKFAPRAANALIVSRYALFQALDLS
jgi:hypothetical protein